MGKRKLRLRISIDNSYINGVTDVIIKALTSGPLLTAYAVGIGVSNMQVGFLLSILPFSNLVHLFVAGQLEKGKSPKKIAWISSLIARPFLLLVALAVCYQNTKFGLVLFVVPYFLSYFIASITGGAYWPWCKELVPKRLMTSFFAKRMQLIVFTRMVTVMFATGVIWLIHKYYQQMDIYCYSWFFVLAFISGLICTFALYNMDDVKLKRSPELPFLQKMQMAVQNKTFLYLLLGIGLANFVLAFYTSFNIVFLLENMKLIVPIVMGFTILSNFADIIATKLWSKYSQRNGIAQMLSRAAIIFILSVCMFVFLSLYKIDNPFIFYSILVLTFILVGAGNAGFSLGVNDASVSFVPEKMSSVYISILNIWRFCATGLGSCIAGIVLSFIGKFDYKWTIFFVIVVFLYVITSFVVKNIGHVKHEKTVA